MRFIEKSASGAYRIPLFLGWAVGFSTEWWPVLWHLDRHPIGWSLRVLWFHIGRKKDRENWTHADKTHG